MRPVHLAIAATVLLPLATIAWAETDTPPPVATTATPAAAAPSSATSPSAAPATDATAPAADGTAASPAPVTGAAAWDLIKGNTLSGKVGGEAFSEFLAADGAVKYVDKDGISTGTWTVQGKKVCLDFPDDDDRSCSIYTVTGAKGYAIDDDNQTTRFDILPGNPKGL